MDFTDFQHAAVTIGNFDGVHLGHQEMVNKVVTQAKSHGVRSLLICFEPQPLEFFSETPPARLTTFAEKEKLLRALGIDEIWCIEFNEDFAKMKAEDFVKGILLDKLAVSYVLVGEDFRFGFQREGNLTLLQDMGKEHGFEAQAINTIKFENKKVSSTQIRANLKQGFFDEAAELLGRPYSMTGTVIEGDKRGRELGYPTANIDPQRKVLPMRGVFAVEVLGLDKTYKGMANLGTRPTVDGMRTLLEVHMFDFDQDVYGKEISVVFMQKTRDEQRFESVNALKQQLREDELIIKNILMG